MQRFVIVHAGYDRHSIHIVLAVDDAAATTHAASTLTDTFYASRRAVGMTNSLRDKIEGTYNVPGTSITGDHSK